METKQCPYCAEEIRVEAIRCRYCRSRLTSFAPDVWHRGHPEARFAGICAALAHALGMPVTAMRVAFVAATLLLPHFIAPMLYVALLLIIPKDPHSDSLLEEWLRWGLALAARVSGRPNGPSGPPTVFPS